jgi:hypothetical protein
MASIIAEESVLMAPIDNPFEMSVDGKNSKTFRQVLRKFGDAWRLLAATRPSLHQELSGFSG